MQTFQSKEHETRYEVTVSRRRVVKDKVLSLKRYEYPKIQMQIAVMGLGKLCERSTIAYQKLVKEFYSNAFRVDGDTIEKFHNVVRDVEVNFSPEKISEFLGINYYVGRTGDFNQKWVVNR